jgi:hypothetical protein
LFQPGRGQIKQEAVKNILKEISKEVSNEVIASPFSSCTAALVAR